MEWLFHIEPVFPGADRTIITYLGCTPEQHFEGVVKIMVNDENQGNRGENRMKNSYPFKS